LVPGAELVESFLCGELNRRRPVTVHGTANQWQLIFASLAKSDLAPMSHLARLVPQQAEADRAVVADAGFRSILGAPDYRKARAAALWRCSQAVNRQIIVEL
jgi:hypothetical protein